MRIQILILGFKGLTQRPSKNCEAVVLCLFSNAKGGRSEVVVKAREEMLEN